MPKNSFFLYGNNGKIIPIANSNIDSICFNLPAEILNKYTVLELPSNLQVNYVLGSNSVSFLWDGTETNYELMLGNATYPVARNKDTIPNLALNTFSWKVRSIKDGKRSLWIKGVSFKTVVDPPYNISLESGSATPLAKFTWSGSADRFEVRIKRKYLKEIDTTYTYFVNGNELSVNQLLAGEYTWNIRASIGNTYSDWIIGKRFAKSDALTVTDVDGNRYPIMDLGEQQWLRENLRVTRFKDGTPLLKMKNLIHWEPNTNSAYTWYNNDSASYYNPYGALYNWYVVNTNKVCPEGWRIPNKEEWKRFMVLIESISIDI